MQSYEPGEAPDPDRVARVDLGILHPFAVCSDEGSLLVSGRALRAESSLNPRPGVAHLRDGRPLANHVRNGRLGQEVETRSIGGDRFWLRGGAALELWVQSTCEFIC